MSLAITFLSNGGNAYLDVVGSEQISHREFEQSGIADGRDVP